MSTPARPMPQTAPSRLPPTELHISAEGLRFIAEHEGTVLHYYNDAANNCTWGIGTLAHTGPCTVEEMRRPVTQDQAQAALRERVERAARVVRENATRSLTQAQFDALTSLTYNAGFSRHVFDTVNAGDEAEAARVIERTAITVTTHDAHGRRVHRVLNGLVRRRTEEARMFGGHG